MPYSLEGKVALITGAAKGIGYGCARELLKCGAQAVTLVDVLDNEGEEAAKKLTSEFGADRAIFVKADVTQADQLEGAFKRTIDAWKKVDIVINNAGILNDALWELEININAGGVVRGTLLGLQYMGKNKGGSGGVVLNVASILGLQPAASRPIYVASKHFVVGFSRSLGQPYHFDRTGVRVLALCPGRTESLSIDLAKRNAFTALSPDIADFLGSQLSALPVQPVENVARGAVAAIIHGNNGSIWLCEESQPPYELDIPDRKHFNRSQSSDVSF